MLRLFSTSPTATAFLIEEFTPNNLTQPGGRSKPREEARAALIAIRQLGRRDARWRLEAMNSNTSSNHPKAKRDERASRKRKVRSTGWSTTPH
jgi:hypothetical protein